MVVLFFPLAPPDLLDFTIDEFKIIHRKIPFQRGNFLTDQSPGSHPKCEFQLPAAAGRSVMGQTAFPHEIVHVFLTSVGDKRKRAH